MPGRSGPALSWRAITDPAFGKIHQPTIKLEEILEKRADTHRICFATTHRNALKHKVGPNFVGSFSVPFRETVHPLFSAGTGLELFSSNFGTYWRSVPSEEEYGIIQDWMQSCGDLVFIRSALALCVALGFNMAAGCEPEQSGILAPEHARSELGTFEYLAKYRQDESAIRKLVDLLCSTRRRLPFYNEQESMVVCAVPPSNSKTFDLPSRLAREVAALEGLPDISADLQWNRDKTSLKTVALEDKWDALEQADLTLDMDLSGKRVILIDDLYQSGTTMQYVAMKLQQAGAYHVYGFAAVKSLRDSDNT